MAGPGKATVNRPVFNCPACHRVVEAQLTLEIGIAADAAPVDGEFSSDQIETKLTGLVVSHDCNKRVTR